MQGSKPGGRGPSGTASTAEPIVAQVPWRQRRRRDVAPLAVRGCSGALRKSVQPESSPRSARARPLRASASCPPSPGWARAMPRRGGPVQHCPPRCVFAFPLCCLLIDRVAAVRSVDFAAEESVVAPPGGTPGTPAGCCWLLDVSLRRVARSGWTCGVGDGTMTSYEPRKDDTRSRSYVRRPFAFLFFFPRLVQKDGVQAAAPVPKRVGGRLGQIFVSASS